MSEQWLNRSDLNTMASNVGISFSEDPANSSIAISSNELNYLREISRENWVLTGLKKSDRVLVSTLQQGMFPIANNADVISPLCEAIAYAEPRGRLRLLHTMKQFKPTVWVCTPCAALDFLARLYMEFNVDPFEIGIEHIVLCGEIASPGTHKRLADEFEATVTDLYCDPVFGAAFGLRKDGKLQNAQSGLIASAAINADTIICDDFLDSGLGEIVLRLENIQALQGKILRTGQVINADEKFNTFHHCRGDLVLARGRWLSLSLIDKALKLIDGVETWQLQIQRGEGTLDRISLKLGLNRPALVENPMWRSRINQSLSSIASVKIEAETYLVNDDDIKITQRVNDMRGYHLATDTQQ